jgi:2-haloacid dehalogenase
MTPSVVLFDVNGTLLDVHSLAPALTRIFGRKLGVQDWLTEVLQYSTALTLASHYVPFDDLAIAVLRMNAMARGLDLKPTHIDAVRTRLQTLQPFRDVTKCLARLKKAGFRIAALTNGTPKGLGTQLRHASLTSFFEATFSVDAVKRYKPARETYQFATESLRVDAADVLMVAAHPWDLLGASQAGCQTALVLRKGKAALPGFRMPDYVVSDLLALSDQLIAGATPKRGRRKAWGATGWTLGLSGLGLGLAVALRQERTNKDSEPERGG